MTNNIGLIILDGWGIGNKSESDAIYNANTPFMDHLLNKYPNATLLTSGEDVGLPEGQMGNSEVGHLNIGAGRIVYQELTRINKSIRDGEFFQNETLIKAFKTAKEKSVAIHFIGLVSNGGVHSSQEHLYALSEMANQFDLPKSYIHAFTDGRDCDPKSGFKFINELEDKIAGTQTKIASVVGRYFAMDRDNRWERIKKAYDLMIHGIGHTYDSAAEAIYSSYASDITDEFIEPSIIDKEGLIRDGDVVVCFNFRTDRPREISIALTQKDIQEYDMSTLDIAYYTMTNYDKTFKNINVIFEKDNLSMTLGEVLSKHNKTQVRIAETEKYPHVTFFFNGGREDKFNGESRILVNSPKVATYDLQPEMSAFEVRDKIIQDIQSNTPNFFCLNFANPDMVGHTGVYSAITKAVETIDSCLQAVIEAGIEKNFEFIVIADHGNADYVINPDGSPNTAHSLNPVPVIHVTQQAGTSIKDGILADVAPTILSRLGLDQPSEMTGEILI
ncbi:MAG: 2,3-bisphosphoglycerate-independent phosphoglycerate mutase [Crocinitomicaceae bacterium]|nr:2,3-bisphosphoglycerate-independent phosphoglycerate mutase [Crocinitomicaceae bacterium]